MRATRACHGEARSKSTLASATAHAPQERRRVEPHAARSLHDRLEDHRRELVPVRGDFLAKILHVALRPGTLESASGALREELRWNDTPEESVHAFFGIADAHRE